MLQNKRRNKHNKDKERVLRTQQNKKRNRTEENENSNFVVSFLLDLDVFPEEPAKNGKWETALMGLSNVTLTPHIGGSTEEAQAAIAEEGKKKKKKRKVIELSLC